MRACLSVLPAVAAAAAADSTSPPAGSPTGYLLDLAVVIIGVTAAFSLNSWRERRKDLQRERTYLLGFERDTESDLAQLAELTGQESARSVRAASFIDSMKAGVASIGDATLMMTDIMTIVGFKPNRTTFTSLMNAGHMDATGDFAFRASLVRLQDEFDTVAEKEGWLREFVSRFAMPFIYDHMDLSDGSFTGPGIVDSPGFRNLVLGYSTLQSQNLRAYEELGSTLSTFRGELRRRLKR